MNFTEKSNRIFAQAVKDYQKLADEMELIEKYKAILSGEVMNTGEKRLVLHHLTRGNVLGKEVWADEEEKGAFYKEQDEKIKAKADILMDTEKYNMAINYYNSILNKAIYNCRIAGSSRIYRYSA